MVTATTLKFCEARRQAPRLLLFWTIGDVMRVWMLGSAPQPRSMMRLLLLALLPAAQGIRLDAQISRASVIRAGTGAAAALFASQAAIAIPMSTDQIEAQLSGKPAIVDKVLYTPPSVKGMSSPEAIALANHLSKMNAKMYGAYWCTHCYDQKMLFGAGGTRMMNYVECAEDGYNSERATCNAKEIKGYPTWEIDGKFYPGQRTLEDLAEISKFDNKAFKKKEAVFEVDRDL